MRDDGGLAGLHVMDAGGLATTEARRRHTRENHHSEQANEAVKGGPDGKKARPWMRLRDTRAYAGALGCAAVTQRGDALSGG
jgi:hypothetical protein